MPAPPVILNNTPLVALWALNQLTLLRDLYTVVWIPQAVETEFLAAERSVRQEALSQAPWIQVRGINNPRHALAYIGLNSGEAQVLALAVEQNARLVIMDERKGRQYAQRLGLPVTGTLGILLLAKEKGFIAGVAPLITQLQTAGLYLNQGLVDKVLTLAGEN